MSFHLVYPWFAQLTHTPTHVVFLPAGDTDPLRIISVAAKDGRSGQDFQLKYTNYKIIGNGSFGVVYHAKLIQGGEDTAIKKVMQDRRFKVGVRSRLHNSA
jgi:serine/threonine protein kinase